jgi:hypothetical protein
MPTWSPKPPDSIEFFPLDLMRHLSKDDRVVSCVAHIEDADGLAMDGMLLGGVEIRGSIVTQKIGGGAAGRRYIVTFTAETFLGETLVQSGDFHVGDTGAGPRDLCRLRAVKEWLNVKTPDTDAVLQRLITFESRTIENHIGRPVLPEGRRDTVIGYGGVTVMPPATPIRHIDSVTVDGAPVAVNHDGLTVWRRDGLSWPRGARIEISYTAGLAADAADPPFDIEQACIELVAFRFRERDHVGMASKAVAGETTAYVTRPMPQSVEARLAPYRKVAPC